MVHRVGEKTSVLNHPQTEVIEDYLISLVERVLFPGCFDLSVKCFASTVGFIVSVSSSTAFLCKFLPLSF